MDTLWEKTYENYLYQYHAKEAIHLAYHHRPHKVYKYFGFNSDYWRANAFEGQIVFNLPANYNDPMDSRWFLDYEAIYRYRFAEIGEKWSKDLLGGEDFFSSIIQLNEEDLLYLREMFCICCFSSTPHSNLMWGHYADKHTGFCLEYDVSCFPQELRILMPVVYTDSPFDASKILDMRGIEDKFATICPLLFKSKDWSYEKEWRILLPNKGLDIPHIVPIPEAVSGVFLGFNCHDEKRNELVGWASNHNIPVYQVERSYLSYDFQSELLSKIQESKHHEGILI